MDKQLKIKDQIIHRGHGFLVIMKCTILGTKEYDNSHPRLEAPGTNIIMVEYGTCDSIFVQADADAVGVFSMAMRGVKKQSFRAGDTKEVIMPEPVPFGPNEEPKKIQTWWSRNG